jgi:hypothetical protein
MKSRKKERNSDTYGNKTNAEGRAGGKKIKEKEGSNK